MTEHTIIEADARTLTAAAKTCALAAIREGAEAAELEQGEDAWPGDYEYAAERLGRELTADECSAFRCAYSDALAAEAEPVEDDLTAERWTDGWVVRCEAGGVWYPDANTCADVESSADPEARILAVCRRHPDCGVWHQ